jgi:major membrane immunogen (membrane-anchored lipoprotein)
VSHVIAVQEHIRVDPLSGAEYSSLSGERKIGKKCQKARKKKRGAIAPRFLE